MLTKLEQIKQSIIEVRKEQSVLQSKITFLIRASGMDGSPEELPGGIQLPLQSDRDLTSIENRLNDVQLKHLLVSYLCNIIYYFLQ